MTNQLAHAELTGTILRIFEPDKRKSFKKATIWLQDINSSGKKNTTWAIEFWLNDAHLVDEFEPGDCVKCEVLITGAILKGDNGEYVKNSLRGLDIVEVKPAEATGNKEQLIKLTVLEYLPAFEIPKGRVIYFKQSKNDLTRYMAEGITEIFNVVFGPYNDLYSIALDILQGKADKEIKARFTAEIVNK